MRRSTLTLVLIAGCAGQPAPPPAGPLLGEQLRQQDEALIGQRFRTILDFENKADTVFVDAANATPASGHTGRGGLHADGPASVRVSSLLFGLTLPADFTLIGGYVRPAGGRVTATLIADGQTVGRTERHVPPGTWALAAVDVTTADARRMLPMAKDVRLVLSGDGGFDLDDVMLIDNRSILVDVPGGWSVRRSGLSLTISVPGRPVVTVPTLAAGDDGWSVDETCPLRVRLHGGVRNAFWTLLPDGRSVLNGRSTGEGGATSELAPPAEVKVEASTGRLDRETAGDSDNDGFNERRAAFQVIAFGGRLRFTVTPRDADATPLVEVRGLPAEPAVVTVDGKLIDTTARLSDGTLLLRLPARLDAAAEVVIGVRAD